jgi:glyoxylase-like metal-dependent hydrolase (beta-lactamase superfamily II)
LRQFIITIIGLGSLITACSDNENIRDANSQTLEIDFVWSSPVPSQSYDAAKPDNIIGWTRRHINMETQAAYEIFTQCYPGGITFRFERFVNQEGTWLRDDIGWRNGQKVQTFVETFQAFVESRASGSLYLKDALDSTENLDNSPIPINEDGVLEVTEGNRTTVYSAITKRGNLRLANQAELRTDGQDGFTLRNTLNFDITDKAIERPTWARTSTDHSPEITIEKLTNNIFIVKNVGDGRNIIALTSDTGWTILGAPLNNRISEIVHNKLKLESGDLPIDNIFVGHAHGDHTGGLQYYINNGARLIASFGIKDQLDILNPGISDFGEIELFDDKTTLSLGDRSVEFHHVNNSHSKGMSFAYIPDLSLIYQGDFLTIPSDGTLTAAMKVTRELDDYLQSNNIRFERMVGHHGHSFITPAMFDAQINLTEQTPKNYLSCSAVAAFFEN